MEHKDDDDWLLYDVQAPHEWLFALGVVSVRFTRFELALLSVFSAITNASAALADSLFMRITNEVRLKVMRDMGCPEDWPPALKDRVEFYLDSAEVLVENRNQLMHSNMKELEGGKVVLSKATRGGFVMRRTTALRELRRVADDMVEFEKFGHLLGAYIKFRFGKGTTRISLPDKPGEPLRLQFPPNPPRRDPKSNRKGKKP